jgi:gluconolactonase
MDDRVHCYAPDGTFLGRILVPNTVSNIRFGGPKNNRLFITANDTLYSLVMGVKAAPMTL